LGKRLVNNELKVPIISDQELSRAVSDPNRLNFVVLKPILDEPHPVLGNEWPTTFDNAYEIITAPLFRNAAVRSALKQAVRS
jgi:hypothetical protein